MPSAVAPSSIAGVVGFFDDSRTLVAAAEQVRDAKVSSFEAFTPYPVHGLDAAMGVKRSKIGIITFVAGLTGFSTAFGFQYWTSAVDWPLNVAGKPFNSWPAFVPIIFELTVLFAGLATFGALLFFCRLPNLKKRAIDPSLTRDRFALLIEAKEPDTFDESGAKELLKKAGAKAIRTVAAEGWWS